LPFSSGKCLLPLFFNCCANYQTFASKGFPSKLSGGVYENGHFLYDIVRTKKCKIADLLMSDFLCHHRILAQLPSKGVCLLGGIGPRGVTRTNFTEITKQGLSSE
jgi:hypothetical protein